LTEHQERYQRLRTLAAEIMAQHTCLEVRDIEVMFTQQSGYATPKLGVRGAFLREDRLLLVRETADEHRWTLLGGWADVNKSPAEPVAREVREESGLEVRPYKLAAVWDRARHPRGVVEPFHI
jgi:ADP-ribose pyrophosphatase YjhB (NUDIX family)